MTSLIVGFALVARPTRLVMLYHAVFLFVALRGTCVAGQQIAMCRRRRCGEVARSRLTLPGRCLKFRGNVCLNQTQIAQHEVQANCHKSSPMIRRGA